MRIIVLLLCCSWASITYGADQARGCASESPWAAVASASRGLTTITHFTMPRDIEPDLVPRDASCLLISRANSNWWLPSQLGSIFELGEFVDDSHILVMSRNVAVISTYLLNLDEQDMQLIGGGAGSVIKEGEDVGLVLLRGQKRYLGRRGGFWLDVLVQLDGEVVEFLPNEQGECVLVSAILRADESRSKLRQDTHECIEIIF